VKDSDDFQHHVEYIRDNPVRARLADNAAAYPYGSASGNWAADPVPPWLKPRAISMSVSPR